MPGDTKEIGEVELVGPAEPYREISDSLNKVKRSTDSVSNTLRMVGSEIVRIDANAQVTQHPKIRVRYVILNSNVANDPVKLTVGSGEYPFVVPAEPVVIPFPLVVERGIPVGFVAAGGVAYLVGDVE